MKRLHLLSFFAFAICAGILTSGLMAEPAKTTQHRFVFELTSDDADAWNALLNNVENVQKALGSTAIVVVVHGKGLSMLTAAKSTPVRKRLEQNAKADVVFAACENTMNKQNVTKHDLLQFAKTVDSGVAEIVRKQEAGWSYVRSGS